MIVELTDAMVERAADTFLDAAGLATGSGEIDAAMRVALTEVITTIERNYTVTAVTRCRAQLTPDIRCTLGAAPQHEEHRATLPHGSAMRWT